MFGLHHHALWFARVGRVPRIFGSGLVARGAACAANNPWRMVERQLVEHGFPVL